MPFATEFPPNKLRVPLARGPVIHRPRLTALLNAGRQRRLTVLSAPAGAGKTTLVSQWLEETGAAAAWLALEPLDDDFVRFWRLVVAALDRLLPGLAYRLAGHLHELLPGHAEPLLAALAHELEQAGQPVTIVLDDLQVVASPAILASLTWLVEALPANVHLLVLTREEPALALPRWRARGELNAVGATELAFTADEGDAFFLASDLPLSAGLRRLALARTGGWAAGLRLLALSLQGEPDPAQWERLLAGYQRDISDYLLAELYRQQPEAVQSFLLATAVTERLTAPLCNALTGRDDGQACLEHLDRRQLMIAPLDRSQEWFRYHPLLAEFLRQLLAREAPEQAPELHRRAAAWFETQGDDAAAIEHYLQGQWHREALALLERVSPPLVSTQWQLLHRWYAALPRPVLKTRPDLYFAYVLLGLLLTDRTAAELEISRAEAFCQELEAGDEAVASQAWGDLYLIKAYHAIKVLLDLELAADYARRHQAFNRRPTLLWNLDTNPGDVSVLCGMEGIGGRPRVGMPFFAEMKDVLPPEKMATLAGSFRIGAAECLYEWNRLDEARTEAVAAYQIGQQQARSEVLAPAAIILSRIEGALGQPETSHEWLWEAGRLLGDRSPKWRRLLEWQRFRLQLPGLPTAAVAEWLREHPLAAEGASLPPHALFEWLIHAGALLKLGRLEEAEARLASVQACAERCGRHGELAEAWLLEARLRQAAGQAGEAMALLVRALQEGAEQSRIRTFVDSGDDIRALLARYAQLRRDNHVRGTDRVPMQYVTELLRHMPGPGAETRVPALSLAMFTPAERQVLALLATGLSNQEMADRLFVTRGTVKTHLNHIYAKLQVPDRWRAIAAAQGLLGTEG